MPEPTTDTPLNDGLPFACDLVMKGGITSGVVYPGALVELSRDHRFHNIGGASAGAIAAVAAAAAEYGRQTGGGGFEELARIPNELAVTGADGMTELQRLFVPQAETAEYFDLIWTQRALKGAGLVARARSVLPTLLRHSPLLPKPLVATLGAMGVFIGAVVWLILDPTASTIVLAVVAAVLALVVYLVARVAVGARAMVADAQTQIANNMHGLCNGRTAGDRTGLTDWLDERIERMAGSTRYDADGNIESSPRPLTYGDLERHEIGLVTITTNLSQSSSENFPFADETWAFDRDELRTLFPDSVAEHVIRCGERATAASGKRELLEARGLLKLPPAADLPILIGARISLSFPVMLSAIPLWRLAPVRTAGDWEMDYQRVWLSDGGICSNMPVHLFDSALPSRPTYGINLGAGATPPPVNPTDETAMTHAHENVRRPIRTGAGDMTPIVSVETTTQLLGEVLTTMQNWSDNSMTRALGVRDRICTIRLGEGEGGMNLDMPSSTIKGLAPRGQAAGESLGWMVRGETPSHAKPDVAADEAATQWTRHRWTRLRSTALGLGHYVDSIEGGWQRPAVPQRGSNANDFTYPHLAENAHDLPYLPYRSEWTSTAGEHLRTAIDALVAVDFADANDKSAPPRRWLTLSTRSAPETEVEV